MAKSAFLTGLAGLILLWALVSVASAGLESPAAYWSFNEGTGATVTDSSGNSNTGTIRGATWDNDGNIGSCLSFDGVDDWATR